MFVVTAVEDITQNKTININVTDPVNSIKLIASPTNTSYNTGDTIDLTGGIIETKTKSGVTKNEARNFPGFIFYLAKQ